MNETIAPRAGVVGWPIEHSRSPTIHRYWLKELGLPGSYEKFAVRPGEFRQFADKIGEDGLVGANVTVPHKEAAFSACDARTPVAEALGAVNTLWRQDGRLWGDNTDVAGFLANLDEAAPGWDERTESSPLSSALAARRERSSTLLISRGFERIAIVNRTQARAEALAAHFGGSTTAAPWADLRDRIAEGGLARQRELAWHGRTAAARHRSQRPCRSTRSSPTRCMFLCARRSSKPRARADCVSRKGWACCFTRPRPPSRAGSAGARS